MSPTSWAKQTAAGDVTEYDNALAIAMVAVGAVLLLAGALLDRISEIGLPGGASFKVGPGATSDARVALAQSGATEDTEDPAHDLLELRLRLEAKLAWLAKHFVGLVGRVRAAALYERTSKLFRDQRGWTVEEITRRRTAQADLSVYFGAGRLRVATVFPYGEKGLNRIEAAPDRLGADGNVVIPCRAPERKEVAAKVASTAGDPVPVVYLDQVVERIRDRAARHE